MATEATLLVVQFLRWIADRPRTYADVQDAWQSTCPLNCAWEDAVSDDLVAACADGFLALTARGRIRLNGAAHPTLHSGPSNSSPDGPCSYEGCRREESGRGSLGPYGQPPSGDDRPAQ